MKRKTLAVILLLTVILCFGCGSAKSSEQPARDNDAAVRPQESESIPRDSGLNLEAAEQKIIKNAEVSIEVRDNLEAEAEIQELVLENRGYIQNTETYKNERRSFTNIEVRIPAENFEVFLTAIKKVGEVTRDRVYSTDVTEEYIDLSARKKTLLVQEERLLEMLKKAQNVDELLKVENELSRVRSEIESITGRLKYLDNKISYSTVRITLNTKYPAGSSQLDGFGAEVLHSLYSGLRTFLDLVLFLIRAVMFLLPFLVIIIPLAYLYYRKKGGKFLPK